MRLTIAIFVFLVLSGTSCIYAERSKSTTETSNLVTRKLFIDPSSTSVRLGKATLIVGPLSRVVVIIWRHNKVRPISERDRVVWDRIVRVGKLEAKGGWIRGFKHRCREKGSRFRGQCPI